MSDDESQPSRADLGFPGLVRVHILDVQEM